MLTLNSSTFFVADMVIPLGRYGLFVVVWPLWLWPIWSVADMVQTRLDTADVTAYAKHRRDNEHSWRTKLLMYDFEMSSRACGRDCIS